MVFFSLFDLEMLHFWSSFLIAGSASAGNVYSSGDEEAYGWHGAEKCQGMSWVLWKIWNGILWTEDSIKQLCVCVGANAGVYACMSVFINKCIHVHSLLPVFLLYMHGRGCTHALSKCAHTHRDTISLSHTNTFPPTSGLFFPFLSFVLHFNPLQWHDVVCFVLFFFLAAILDS